MPSEIHALVPTGFGINCEVETGEALRRAGASPTLVHLNDLIEQTSLWAQAQILVLPGGFSFGDHLGAGKVLANRLRIRLGPTLRRFVADGGLVLGICNGFQTMARLGLVPFATVDDDAQVVALAPNQHGHFYDGWISLRVDPDSPCVFTRHLQTIELPVRHGEGRIVTDNAVLDRIRNEHLCPLRYGLADGEATTFPQNPNGSPDGIAGLCDPSGRLFGLMPHPEAFLYPHNHPLWRRRANLPKDGDGLQIFVNAVDAARGR